MTDQPIVTATNLLLGVESSASAGSAGAAASATPSWISSLLTSSIKTDMAAADVNGVVTAKGLTTLLTDLEGNVGSSGLTQGELSDLQTIAANLKIDNGLSVSSYLAYVFNALANSNPANADWTGGLAGPVTLGNLEVDSSQTQLGELIGKWFQGTDLPPDSFFYAEENDTYNNITYPTVSNALFGASGPSKDDINQGVMGDCYFLASCAEVAAMNPTHIESMFSNNGNGTYGVRFYYDGAPEYVTVNMSLADGGKLFNKAPDIWASLAETAWAEFQAINPDTGVSGYNDGNSWNSIGNGGSGGCALEALTGASKITEFWGSSGAWYGETYNSSLDPNPGSYTSPSAASVLQTIETDLKSGDDVVLDSTQYDFVSSQYETLIQGHVMSIYAYDSSNGDLWIRNPWGTNGTNLDSYTSHYWETIFEVPLATLLADGDEIDIDNVGGTSALPNPAPMANYLNNISAYDAFVSGIQISDAASAVAASFDALNADSDIASITLTDSGVPALSLTTTQAANDTTALGEISNQAFEVIAGGAHTYYDHSTALVTVTDSNATFLLSGGAQAKVTGGRDAIDLSGSGDVANLYGTGGNWDSMIANNGTVYLTSAQTAVYGGGDWIDFAGGSGNVASLYNTGGNWDSVLANNGTVYLTSAQTAVTGGGDWIDFAGGSGNAASLYNTGGNWDSVIANNGAVYLISAQTAVTGGGDGIVFYGGSGNAASLYSTGANADTVTGSNGTISLSSAQATVTGTGDTLDLSGTSAVTANGGSNAFVFGAAIGTEVINGFVSTDTIQFSASDFANWSALSSHMTQSGANTVITLNSSNTVTLDGVTATTLTSSEFKFV